MNIRINRCLAQVMWLALCIAAGSEWDAAAQSVTPVPKLDLNQITGTWYEIARYPNKREKKCLGNAVMLVALGDKANHFQLVYTCKIKAGYTDAINIDGKAQDKAGDGKLKLGSIWPLYRKFWVLAVGPENAWSLVGSPNHKDLWIYSRMPALAPDAFAQIQARAVAQGFSAAKLTQTPQGLKPAE